MARTNASAPSLSAPRASDPIARLDPPGLIRTVLRAQGVKTIGDLARYTSDDLWVLPGVGHRRAVLLEALHTRARAVVDGTPVPVPETPPTEAQELARRLEIRGLDLSQPWSAVLVMLSRRVRRELQGVGLITLRDVVDAIDPPRPLGWTQGPGAMPWEEALPLVSARVETVFHRLKLTTMEDVLAAWLGGRFVGTRNFGRRSYEEVRRALLGMGANPVRSPIHGRIPGEVSTTLEAIARDGLEVWRHGSPEPITTPADLIARTLGAMDEEIRSPLRDWLLGKRKIASFAAEHGVAWHTASRPLFNALAHLRLQFGDVARVLAAPLLAELEARGPLLHKSDVARALPGITLRQARYILAIAGRPVMHRWRKRFLAELRPSRMDLVVQDLRLYTHRLPIVRRTLDALAERLHRKEGMQPLPAVMVILVRSIMGGQITADGHVAVRFAGQKTAAFTTSGNARRKLKAPPAWMRD